MTLELFAIFLLVGLYSVGFLTGFFVGRSLAIDSAAKDLLHGAAGRLAKKRSSKVIPFTRGR